MSSSEIAFLAVGLIIGAAIGAAIAEAIRVRPAPRRQVRVTISPNSVSARRSATLSDPAASAGRPPGPGSPDERSSPADEAAGVDDLVTEPPTDPPSPAPSRTGVPSAVALPASTVAVPVDPAAAVPVGPGVPTPARAAPPSSANPTVASPTGDAPRTLPTDAGMGGAGDAPRPDASSRPGETVTAASAAVTSTALASAAVAARAPAAMTIGLLVPVATPGAPAAAPVASALDVGVVAAGVVVRTRPPAVRPRPAIPPDAVAMPVARPLAALQRRSADEPADGAAPAPASAMDPCDGPRRAVDERCELTSTARENARTAADALREAQRGYDRLREQLDRAESVADPREVAAAKDDLHRRFRDASAMADDAAAGEAAARAWLDAINELNGRVREATRFLERGGAELRATQPRIERLAVEADAARISAENAAAGCHEARERLASCEEALAIAARAAATSAPAAEPHPFDALWPGESASTRNQPVLAEGAGSPESGEGLPVVIRIVRGDGAALTRLVASLADGDAEATRAWQLRLSALVDAITARAIEDGYLDLPDDHAFWGPFSFAERREIVASLSALGYRFDGLGGFADARVPTARDLSLAVGYAGLDRMRIRTWPREGEAAELFARASVAADEWLAERADDLSLGQMVDALGSRAAALVELWNAWGRVRPALLADA